MLSRPRPPHKPGAGQCRPSCSDNKSLWMGIETWVQLCSALDAANELSVSFRPRGSRAQFLSLHLCRRGTAEGVCSHRAVSFTAAFEETSLALSASVRTPILPIMLSGKAPSDVTRVTVFLEPIQVRRAHMVPSFCRPAAAYPSSPSATMALLTASVPACHARYEHASQRCATQHTVQPCLSCCLEGRPLMSPG